MSQLVLLENPLGVTCSRIIAHQIVVSDVWHQSHQQNNDNNNTNNNATRINHNNNNSNNNNSSNNNTHLVLNVPASVRYEMDGSNGSIGNSGGGGSGSGTVVVGQQPQQPQHIVLLSCQDRGVVSSSSSPSAAAASGQERKAASYSMYRSVPISTFALSSSSHKNIHNNNNNNNNYYNNNHNNNSAISTEVILPFTPNSLSNSSSSSSSSFFLSSNLSQNDHLRMCDGKESLLLPANPSWMICPNTSANAQLGYSMEAVEHPHNHVELLRRHCNTENHANSNTIDVDNLDQIRQHLTSTHEQLFCGSSQNNYHAKDRNWNDSDLQACLEKQKQQPPTQTPEKVKEKDDPISKSKEAGEKQPELTLLPWEIPEIDATNGNCRSLVENVALPTSVSTGHHVIKRHCGVSDKKYACKMCGKKYKYESNLVTHATVHTERALECEFCHKKFGRKTNYVEHLRIHTNERPYKCRYCGKSFKQNHGWRDHERTHTNERPHVCEVCGKGFTVGHNLAVHKRIHTGEKPYGCDRCEKRFRQKSAYNAHMKNVHKTPHQSAN